MLDEPILLDVLAYKQATHQVRAFMYWCVNQIPKDPKSKYREHDTTIAVSTPLHVEENWYDDDEKERNKTEIGAGCISHTRP